VEAAEVAVEVEVVVVLIAEIMSEAAKPMHGVRLNDIFLEM